MLMQGIREIGKITVLHTLQITSDHVKLRADAVWTLQGFSESIMHLLGHGRPE